MFALLVRALSITSLHIHTTKCTSRVEKTQLDAQLIFSIFRQPLHVSGVPRPITRRYNRMHTICTYHSFFFPIQPGQQTVI